MRAARMPRRAAAVVAMLALGLASGTASAALVLPDRPQGRVSDYARALDGASRQRLEGQIAQATQGRTLQYAVAIFPSLEGEAIEDVSIRLAERWKIGGKQDSDGVLLTVFLADRKLRIEVGYGLEGKLTDVQSARIIREVMAPRLRAGDLAGGLEAGIAAINEAVGGNPITGSTARPLAHTGPRAKKVPGWLLLLVLGGIIFIVWIVPWNPRPRRGGWPGGWSGGSGGFGGFGGGGGGGGGGFSGGGGSFGGGGASGGW